MQSHPLKFLSILVIFFFSAFLVVGQKTDQFLQKADSLFEAKQYTQSIKHYKALLDQKKYSPAMLLKMAYIQEGLNQVGEALYYLNLYYLATNDRATLDKMELLATKYNLEGYTNTDVNRAFSMYHDYHPKISFALAVIIFFLFSLSFYLKKKNQRPLASVIVLSFFVIILGIHINIGEKISAAIVEHPNTYLMAGPSAGAPVVSIIQAGHRIEVVGKHDVWLQIIWNGETVYVKENNLLPVTL